MMNPKLLRQIMEILQDISLLTSVEGRQAFLNLVGLPQELKNMIDTNGPTAVFIPMLVETALKYGTLDDGQPALYAILNGAKEYKGIDKKKIVDDVILSIYGKQFHSVLEQNSLKSPIGRSSADVETPIVAFVASDPLDASRLRAPKEFRDIDQIFQLAPQPKKYALTYQMAALPEDISRIILHQRPQILHFSVHGTSDGRLRLEDHAGMSKFVEMQTLAEICQLTAGSIKCIVLNACGTDRKGHLLAPYVDYVIAMPREIQDAAARTFSIGFYKALLAGKNIERSFEFGCTEMKLHGMGNFKPVIFKKESL